jgi:hypothetical protein
MEKVVTRGQVLFGMAVAAGGQVRGMPQVAHSSQKPA